MVRLNISMPESANTRLEALAEGERNKSVVIEKALILYEFAHKAAKEGKKLAILTADGNKETEIIGL